MTGEKIIYCPYSDAEIPLSATSPEHVIPLSLGGHDDFILPVDATFNAKAGTEIDGKIANDFLMLMKRRDHDARGHSGKPPEPVLKKAKDAATGRPIQVNLGKNLQVWDAKDRKNVPPGGMTFEATFKIELEPPVQFLAKTFLSAGHFVYGDLFRQKVKHQDVRLLMRGPSTLTEAEIGTIQTRMFRDLQGDLEDPVQQQEYDIQRLLCHLVRGSLVVFFPSADNTLCMFCGILGAYMGMLAVPANVSALPIDGGHDLGHAVIVSNGKVLRWSYRRFLTRMVPEIQKLQERTAKEAAAPKGPVKN